MTGGRRVSDMERRLWQRVNQRSVVSPVQPAAQTEPTSALMDKTTASVIPSLRLDDMSRLDKKTAAQLKAGLLKPEATLDLHGFTLERFEAPLLAFLTGQPREQRRLVLVITGKGKGAGLNPLKRHTLFVLERYFADTLLCVCHASAKHGGKGALYILFRKAV